MWSGSFRLARRTDPSAFAACLVERLRREQASWVDDDGDAVRFRGGIGRFVPNWNVLIAFDAGEVRLDASGTLVTYRLHFPVMVILATLVSVVILLNVPPRAQGPFLAAFLWLAFAVVVPCLEASRFRGLLEDAAAEAAPRQR